MARIRTVYTVSAKTGPRSIPTSRMPLRPAPRGVALDFVEEGVGVEDVAVAAPAEVTLAEGAPVLLAIIEEADPDDDEEPLAFDDEDVEFFTGPFLWP